MKSKWSKRNKKILILFSIMLFSCSPSDIITVYEPEQKIEEKPETPKILEEIINEDFTFGQMRKWNIFVCN